MGPLSNFRRKAQAPAAATGVPQPPPEAGPTPPADAGRAVICRPAKREEVRVGLRVVLGANGRLADDDQVVDFMQFALRRGISLADLWVAELTTGGGIVWSLLPIVSPGRTMLLLGPADPPRGTTADVCGVVETLVEGICLHFAARGVQLAQVLLDPADTASRRRYEGGGFGRVAELVYLHAATRRKAAAPALPPGFSWVGYGADTHARFVAAIAETYRDSLDCPALNGVRDMEDVLAGHKASGEFDPDLWLLLCESAGDGAGRPAARGVLLLSRMQPGDALELVYLGLTPAARGRGLGDLLVTQALSTAAARKSSRLSLAVDSENTPALKLYFRHGLQRVASKVALMRLLRPGNGRAGDAGGAPPGAA